MNFFLLDSKEDILKNMGNQVVDGIDFHCVLWKSICLAWRWRWRWMMTEFLLLG